MTNLNKNIARNINFSWCISLLQGSLRISLTFLNIIVVPLGHVSVTHYEFTFNRHRFFTSLGTDANKRVSRVFLFTISSHGANLFSSCLKLLLYKSSVAFFMITPLPSVLRLSRSTKKGRNFNLLIVIGSGKIRKEIFNGTFSFLSFCPFSLFSFKQLKL